MPWKFHYKLVNRAALTVSSCRIALKPHSPCPPLNVSFDLKSQRLTSANGLSILLPHAFVWEPFMPVSDCRTSNPSNRISDHFRNRMATVIVAACVTAMSSPAQCAEPSRVPNIVIILADDKY